MCAGAREGGGGGRSPPTKQSRVARWALAGAGTSLAASLVEYWPHHLGDLHLETVHPLYGLAWLGLGELLALLPGCDVLEEQK